MIGAVTGDPHQDLRRFRHDMVVGEHLSSKGVISIPVPAACARRRRSRERTCGCRRRPGSTAAATCATELTSLRARSRWSRLSAGSRRSVCASPSTARTASYPGRQAETPGGFRTGREIRALALPGQVQRSRKEEQCPLAARGRAPGASPALRAKDAEVHQRFGMPSAPRSGRSQNIRTEKVPGFSRAS